MKGFCKKCQLIRQIIKSDNAIVVLLDKDEFKYLFSGKSLMFAQLFQRLNRYIPDWYKKWLNQNKIG